MRTVDELTCRRGRILTHVYIIPTLYHGELLDVYRTRFAKDEMYAT
jgi:hypothetical protein